MKESALSFTFEETNEVRTLITETGIWFVGKDVALVLGHANPERAIRKFVDEEDRGVTESVTPGGKQRLTIINEPGLYSLVLASKTDGAKKFKRWITHEVIPAIREKGYYSLLTDEKLIELIIERQRHNDTFLDMIEKPKIKSKLLAEDRMKKNEETALLYLSRESYTSKEYRKRLKEIWKGDMPGLHTALDDYDKWFNKVGYRIVGCGE